jgi:hypothetical protein
MGLQKQEYAEFQSSWVVPTNRKEGFVLNVTLSAPYTNDIDK